MPPPTSSRAADLEAAYRSQESLPRRSILAEWRDRLSVVPLHLLAELNQHIGDDGDGIGGVEVRNLHVGDLLEVLTELETVIIEAKSMAQNTEP